MINFDTVANKIFKVLKGHGYRLKLYTDEGMETVDPDEARWFYVKEPNMMVLLDQPNEEVKVNKNSTVPLAAYESTLKQIKRIATHYILNFTIRNFDKEVEPKGFSPEAKKRKKQKQKMDKIAESSFSKLNGSRRTSKQTLEGVKIIVKHKDPVDENVRGSRSRGIKSIFIENNGDRTQFPYPSLKGARAMARHVQCGGTMDDTIGKHICSVTENLSKLSQFYNQVKKQNIISESNMDVIALISENIQSYISELKSFSGSKTYKMAKSMVTEQEIVQEEGDIEALRDMFTVKQFNEQFEGVMELLNNMVSMNKKHMIRLQEAASQPILCKSSPLSEDSVVEYTSKGAKLGNKLLNLSNVIVGNGELVEYVIKVGKKLIAEQSLSDFEVCIVKSVLSNVVVEKKLPSETKDLVESYVSKLELSLSKYEYPTLLHLKESISESGVSKYKNMSPAEWKAEYERLEARYKELEAAGEHDRAERVGDMISDMEMWCPDEAECIMEDDGDVVVKNDGDIVGSFLREFDYDAWGISHEDMRDLNMFYQEEAGDRVDVSEADMSSMLVDIMERAEKDGMHLAFNEAGDIVEVKDDNSLTEDQLETPEELSNSFKQIAALIKQVYKKYTDLVTNESVVTEWKYRGSNIDLPEHILDGIKREIDVLVTQYKAAIKGISLANQLNNTPNGERHIKRVMATRNRIWSRLSKLDRMLGSIER